MIESRVIQIKNKLDKEIGQNFDQESDQKSNQILQQEFDQEKPESGYLIGSNLHIKDPVIDAVYVGFKSQSPVGKVVNSNFIDLNQQIHDKQIIADSIDFNSEPIQDKDANMGLQT